MNRATAIAAIAFTTLCAGCVGSPSSPSPSAVATFAVAHERFRVSLTSEEQIAAAGAAQAGGRARIPTGRMGAFPICSGAAKQAGIGRLAEENWPFFASHGRTNRERSRPNRLRHAGQCGMELAPRGCHIRGKCDRAVRWQATGRGTTGISFGGGRYCPWAATIVEIVPP
jgi:hypothetical protein